MYRTTKDDECCTIASERGSDSIMLKTAGRLLDFEILDFELKERM